MSVPFLFQQVDVFAVMLSTRDEVLALRPDYSALAGINVGVLRKWTEAEADVEVSAFMGEEYAEDPVTGSLNASLAQWLIAEGQLPERYVSSQGTAIGRRGRVWVERAGTTIWVGGQIQPCISGTVYL
ncbi:MAG: putative PhzF superfamily epimerase YddE/YHI9 [Halopseudomonas sp.]|jgi:predicted PhzF superfamily epimerase YddE/YHI9